MWYFELLGVSARSVFLRQREYPFFFVDELLGVRVYLILLVVSVVLVV